MKRMSFLRRPAAWLTVVGLMMISGCPAPDTPTPTDNVVVSAEAPTRAESGESVTLAAKIENLPASMTPTYRWYQTYGSVVDLQGADTASPSFVAPAIRTEQTLRFRVDVIATDFTRSATTEIVVAADSGLPDPNSGDGDNDPRPRVRVFTSKGNFVLELRRDRAPITVANFLRYVDDGFYTDLIFHRVIEDFVIQTGGYLEDEERVTTGVRPPITLESENGLRNDRGTIAMARTNEPNSASSQWYINLVDNDSLNFTDSNPGYAVFGRVIEGLSVVDAIGAVDTTTRNGLQDVPVDPVFLQKVERITE